MNRVYIGTLTSVIRWPRSVFCQSHTDITWSFDSSTATKYWPPSCTRHITHISPNAGDFYTIHKRTSTAKSTTIAFH